MGSIGAPGANRDLLVNVEDALEEGLDSGVAESIDVVYLGKLSKLFVLRMLIP